MFVGLNVFHVKHMLMGVSDIMTEFSSADLCKLSVQDVADLLLDGLGDRGSCGCKVYGCSDGRMFELEMVMREVE